MKMMTIETLRDQLIADAIASVHEHEKRENRRLGGLEGLELCRSLSTFEAFQAVLKERQRREDQWDATDGTPDDYWRHRVGTAQIEYVFDVLCIGWEIYPQSARAALRYAEIVGVAEV